MDSGQSGYGGWGDYGDGGRERGSRRKKVYGYLKAANELRQAYSAQWAQKYQDRTDSQRDMPGGFPEVEPITYGNEEMVLFPSYARRHVRRHPREDAQSEMEESDDLDMRSQTMKDPDYWQKEWEKYEDDRAIVDVDVKGWIYSPHQGPLNRKNRILISLARKLSGIPAPDLSSLSDSDSDPSGSSRERLNHDEALVNKEANAILKKEQETASQSRQESSLSQSDIAAANAELMERLNPFLRNPIVGLPATIFFFDDKQSQSRTVMTNAGGHFYIRAALEFVPTHIRVIAAENLSATAEVKIYEPQGVSMISDIDDTIKHSAIADGAKEMFRNTFVRNLSDLTVLGVKEWYTQVADMGVGIHYVSNSPWQLYPLLKNFFTLAGLPHGSFHLKQYSGMLQGIFEPTSERKRSTLERIMQDFPERRFILVGDSGEADLEAYSDLVLANPGKILAIFIRDVTTSNTGQFFDKSVAHLEKPDRSIMPSRRTVTDCSDAVDHRPSLPPRRPVELQESNVNSAVPVGNLIDLDSEDESSMERCQSTPDTKQTPPPPPPKPSGLRAASLGDKNQASIARKPVPPVPDKPSQLTFNKIGSQPHGSAPSPTLKASKNNEGHLSSARNRASDMYNNMPPAHDIWENRHYVGQVYKNLPTRSKNPPPVPPRRSTNSSNRTFDTSKSTPDFFQPNSISTRTSSTSSLQQFFRPPPQRLRPSQTSIYSSNSTPNLDQPILSKREESWIRRWARAQEILGERGVILATWRVGSDVQDLCVSVIEQALADDRQRTRGDGR